VEEAEARPFDTLPAHVITAIIGLLSRRSQLAARQVARTLRKPAADCIHALVSRDGSDLPEGAWAAFALATHLVIAARPEGRCTAHHEALLVANMPRLLARLPRQLRTLHVRLPHPTLSAPQGRQLAAALAASPCCSGLLELHWALPLCACGADLLLGAMASLQVRR
jgi:hypothetical protein